MKYCQAKQLIEAIAESNYTTTDREDDFIENILDRKFDLSSKQSKWLSQIYSKSSGNSSFQRRHVI